MGSVKDYGGISTLLYRREILVVLLKKNSLVSSLGNGMCSLFR